MIDFNTSFGQHTIQRLHHDQVIWLVTTGADGTPQPSPVWFLWHNNAALIYSRPNTPKLANIARQPKVALHFNSTESGGDVVTLTGTAQQATEPVAPEAQAAFLAKYSAGIASLGATPESFLTSYSVPLLVSPAKLRGHWQGE